MLNRGLLCVRVFWSERYVYEFEKSPSMLQFSVVLFQVKSVISHQRQKQKCYQLSLDLYINVFKNDEAHISWPHGKQKRKDVKQLCKKEVSRVNCICQ